jgi:hypothetical protein
MMNTGDSVKDLYTDLILPATKNQNTSEFIFPPGLRIAAKEDQMLARCKYYSSLSSNRDSSHL